MKKILLYSSGTICRAIMAETLLKKAMSAYAHITFYSGGVFQDSLGTKSTLDILKNEKNIFATPNIQSQDEIYEQKFDLVFLLFNLLTEKAMPPLCKGNMYYIGYQGEVEDLDYTFKYIQYKVNQKIKPLIMKDLGLHTLMETA